MCKQAVPAETALAPASSMSIRHQRSVSVLTQDKIWRSWCSSAIQATALHQSPVTICLCTWAMPRCQSLLWTVCNTPSKCVFAHWYHVSELDMDISLCRMPKCTADVLSCVLSLMVCTDTPGSRSLWVRLVQNHRADREGCVERNCSAERKNGENCNDSSTREKNTYFLGFVPLNGAHLLQQLHISTFIPSLP